MKLTFLSFSDYKGGASIAAYEIFKSIKLKKSFFLTVYGKHNKSKEIYNFIKKIYISILRVLEKILIFFVCKKKYHQSLNIFNTFSKNKITNYNSDILNIHWINRSMISLKELISLNQKIVISLHDTWFLNSTEHYTDKADKNGDFLSNYCRILKKKLANNKNVFFIAHNNWMLNKFKLSYPTLKKKIFLSKFYPIDTKVFRPKNKIKLREKYNIPKNKIVIFFSAQNMDDQRKGFIYFKKILKKLSKKDKFFFISLGHKNSAFLGIDNYKHFDFLPYKETSDIYSLSDIYICTSLIDNLPLTVLEALSSGNLVISFKNGGVEEVLKKTGYTFKISEISKLTDFIGNLSMNKIKTKSIISRRFALKNFNSKITKKNYLSIFKNIIKKEISYTK